MSSEWGRIDDDGTVYLRTADGERVIGSWHAGTPEDGIEFYTRRYTELAAEVTLLEGRVKSAASDPAAVGTAARKLREVVPSAAAMGDLDALVARLDAVLAAVAERQAEKAKERAAAATAAADRKRALWSPRHRSCRRSDSWRDDRRALPRDGRGMEGHPRASTGGPMPSCGSSSRRPAGSSTRAGARTSPRSISSAEPPPSRRPSSRTRPRSSPSRPSGLRRLAGSAT